MLRFGPKASEHELEIDGSLTGEGAGEAECRLDSASAVRVNWARISSGLYSILIGGRSYKARVGPLPAGRAEGGGSAGARPFSVRVGAETYRVEIYDPRSRRRGGSRAGSDGPEDISAPMPGKIVKLLVADGDQVEEGQGLLVMEAMKMQNELRSPRAGRVDRIYATEGAGVESGAPLVRLASP